MNAVTELYALQHRLDIQGGSDRITGMVNYQGLGTLKVASTASPWN